MKIVIGFLLCLTGAPGLRAQAALALPVHAEAGAALRTASSWIEFMWITSGNWFRQLRFAVATLMCAATLQLHTTLFAAFSSTISLSVMVDCDEWPHDDRSTPGRDTSRIAR